MFLQPCNIEPAYVIRSDNYCKRTCSFIYPFLNNNLASTNLYQQRKYRTSIFEIGLLWKRILNAFKKILILNSVLPCVM